MNTKESSNAAWALLSIVCERARVFLMFATALFSFSSSLSVLYCCLSCTSNSTTLVIHTALLLLRLHHQRMTTTTTTNYQQCRSGLSTEDVLCAILLLCAPCVGYIAIILYVILQPCQVLAK